MPQCIVYSVSSRSPSMSNILVGMQFLFVSNDSRSWVNLIYMKNTSIYILGGIRCKVLHSIVVEFSRLRVEYRIRIYIKTLEYSFWVIYIRPERSFNDTLIRLTLYKYVWFHSNGRWGNFPTGSVVNLISSGINDRIFFITTGSREWPSGRNIGTWIKHAYSYYLLSPCCVLCEFSERSLHFSLLLCFL